MDQVAASQPTDADGDDDKNPAGEGDDSAGEKKAAGTDASSGGVDAATSIRGLPSGDEGSKKSNADGESAGDSLLAS